MLKDIKTVTPTGSTMRGYADFSRISPGEIAALSGKWQNPTGTVCKRGSSTVAFIDSRFFVKCSPAGRGFRRTRRLFQIPRPLNALWMNRILNALEIPTPEIFCAVRESRNGLPVCDYLVTEILDPASSCTANCYVMTDDQDRQTLFKSAAEILGKLHHSNIIHGDASTKNFYLTKSSKGTSVGMIDFDSCTKILIYRAAFRKEIARFISSYLMGCGNESDSDIEISCTEFLDIYSKFCSKKHSVSILSRDIKRFFASTSRKWENI